MNRTFGFNEFLEWAGRAKGAMVELHSVMGHSEFMVDLLEIVVDIEWEARQLCDVAGCDPLLISVYMEGRIYSLIVMEYTIAFSLDTLQATEEELLIEKAQELGLSFARTCKGLLFMKMFN